jgi:putative redox protein
LAKVIATAEAENNGEIYQTKVCVNHHTLIVDEPPEVGGKDTGPAPGDYLCMALASCTAITLRMYVDRKKWQVEKIKVKVTLVKGTETPSGNNTFYCSLSFVGVLDSEQQKRLQQIASACPIHRLLHKPSDIFTVLE